MGQRKAGKKKGGGSKKASGGGGGTSSTRAGAAAVIEALNDDAAAVVPAGGSAASASGGLSTGGPHPDDGRDFECQCEAQACAAGWAAADRDLALARASISFKSGDGRTGKDGGLVSLEECMSTGFVPESRKKISASLARGNQQSLSMLRAEMARSGVTSQLVTNNNAEWMCKDGALEMDILTVKAHLMHEGVTVSALEKLKGADCMAADEHVANVANWNSYLWLAECAMNDIKYNLDRTHRITEAKLSRARDYGKQQELERKLETVRRHEATYTENMPLVVREVELFRQHEVFSVFCNHINVHWEKGGAGHRLVPKEKVDVAEEAVLSFDDMLQALKDEEEGVEDVSGVGWSPIPCIDGEIFLVGALRQGVDIAATWEHLPVGNPSSMKGGMPPHVMAMLSAMTPEQRIAMALSHEDGSEPLPFTVEDRTGAATDWANGLQKAAEKTMGPNASPSLRYDPPASWGEWPNHSPGKLPGK